MAPRERQPLTRRVALSTVGTATLASLAGCVVSSAADRPAATTAATGTPTETATATPTSDDSYSGGTVRRAREVGTAIRDSVVAMSNRPPRLRGTGWYSKRLNARCSVTDLY